MLEQYYRINQAAGVAIQLNLDGTIAIHAVDLIAKGNQLDIDKKVTDLVSVEELKKVIPTGASLALNLSGKGILNKQIEKTEAIDQGNFNKILPNAKPDDFYIQNFISGELSFVSVIRKVEADKWIEQLKQIGLTPLMLSLGPFPVQNIIPQLNSYGEELVFNGNIIRRNSESNWTNVKYEISEISKFPLKIEFETINEKLIIAYAVAFQLILEAKLEFIKADVFGLNSDLQKKLADNKLKVNGFLILAVLFITLLINFAMFSWLTSANDRLTLQLSRSARNTTNIQDINEQVKNKEGLLQNLGWDGGINKSSLIDQVAALMPEDITLQSIALNPIDINSTRVQKFLIFFNGRMKISGTSEKIIPVNEWIARIKTKGWVRNIQLDNYAFNSELNTGQFNLILNY